MHCWPLTQPQSVQSPVWQKPSLPHVSLTPPHSAWEKQLPGSGVFVVVVVGPPPAPQLLSQHWLPGPSSKMGQPARSVMPVASKAKSERRFIIVLQEGRSAVIARCARQPAKRSKRHAPDKVASLTEKAPDFGALPRAQVKVGSREPVTKGRPRSIARAIRGARGPARRAIRSARGPARRAIRARDGRLQRRMRRRSATSFSKGELSGIVATLRPSATRLGAVCSASTRLLFPLPFRWT